MTTTYTVYVTHAAGQSLYAEDIPSMTAAKSIARGAYDETHPMRVMIAGSDGRDLVASQPHGRGMLWGH